MENHKSGKLVSKDQLARFYYRIYARYDAAAIANSLLGRAVLWAVGIFGNVFYTMRGIERRPWFVRSSMRSVRRIMTKALGRRETPFLLPDEVRDLKDLRVACIADEFTRLAFSFECHLLSLHADRWKKEIEEFRPHMLFVESAWEGKDDSWKWKVSVLSPELVDLVHWCKSRGIPTIFWNKEDPKHFETFIRSAAFFDAIFTTDLGRIADYRTRLDTDRVFLLPFAAQPAIHNPVETYERKDAFCFAGAYYTKQLDRNRTFAKFVEAISSLGELEIFDRYQNTVDERLIFPKVYEQFIIGSLETDHIDVAYKSYLYGVNMNTIKHSQTMFARRVYELLASNTITVGNYSRGQKNMLGDLAICTDDIEWLKQRIRIFQGDRDLRDKHRLAGLRTVMGQHTYRHRLHYMAEKVFDRPLDLGMPKVAVVSAPKSIVELDRVVEQFEAQTYGPKDLWLVISEDLTSHVEGHHVISMLKEPAFKVCNLEADMLCIFHPEDYHGRNYLTDLALGAWWSGADAVGKVCYLSGPEAMIVNGGKEYKFYGSLPKRSSLICASALGEAHVKDLLIDVDDGLVSLPICLSLDRFNYCRGGGDSCPAADDILVDQGLPISYLNQLVESKVDLNRCISKPDAVLIYGKFPRPNRADNLQFLIPRPVGYRNLGLKVEAVMLNDGIEDEYYDVQGISINRIGEKKMRCFVDENASERLHVHMLDEALWALLSSWTDRPITVWVYGPEMLISRSASGKDDDWAVRSRAMWASLIDRPNVSIVFPSRYLHGLATKLFGRISDSRCEVRPVPISPPITASRIKNEEKRKRILCLKSYAGSEIDESLLVETILELSVMPRFGEVTITIMGQWPEGIFARLRGLPNVHIDLAKTDMAMRAEAYARNAILLAPLLSDLNGIALAEAMSMGLVPVVTNTGSVREFVGNDCGIVAEGARDLAMGVMTLIYDQKKLAACSGAALTRAEILRRISALGSEIASIGKMEDSD